MADASSGLIRVQNTESRRRALQESINAVLTGKGAMSREFETLRGRLLFAENQVFGRSANRAFREISSARRPSGFVSLTAPLAAALEVLRDRIILGDPRCISVAEPQNFHLYTDACFEQNQGGTGGMLYGKGGLLLRWFSEWRDNVAEINEDNKKGLIFELELAAVLMGLTALCSSIHKADVIVFCDNEAVVGALVSGRSDIPLAAKWLENIFSMEEKQDLCLWFERVPSESNPADEPSRGITEDLPESIKVPANLPSP